MRRRLRSLLAAGAAAACTVTGFVACGDGADQGKGDLFDIVQSGGQQLCASTPGVSRTGINLGLLYSASADLRDPGSGFRAGVDARLGAANATGGIQGRRFTYDLADDEASTTLNAVGGRNLARDHDTLGILQFSAASAGSAAMLTTEQVPVIDGQVTDPGVGTHNNVFSYARPLVSQPATSSVGDFLDGRGARRVAIVSLQLSTGTQTMARIAEQSVRAAGLRVAASLQVPAGPLDRQGFANQLIRAKADSLLAYVPAPTFYQLIQGVRDARLGLSAIIGNPTTYDPGQLATLGGAAAGVYAFLDYRPLETGTAAHRLFLSAMAAHAPQSASMPTGPALIGWISTDLLLRGITAAGPCPTRASVLDSLRHLDRYDADGLLPAPIDLSHGVAAVRPCYNFVQVTPNGAGFAPIDTNPQCGTVLPAT